MLPLSLFLLIWFVMLGIFVLVAFISVFQMLRYGLASPGTYVPTILFLVISSITIFGVSWSLVGVDWTQTIPLFNSTQDVLLLDF